MPKITIIKPAGTTAQKMAETYFKTPFLYFKGMPNVLNNERNPWRKCVAINKIEIIYIIAVGVWPKNPNLLSNI